MGRKISKKILKVILWILGVFIMLDLMLVLLAFFPPVQKKLIDTATHFLSQKTESECFIEKIYLTPTFKITAIGVTFNDHHKNHLIYAGKIKGNIIIKKCSAHGIYFGNVVCEKAEVIIRKYSGEKQSNISLWAKHFKSSKKSKIPFILDFKALKLKNSRLLVTNDNRCKHYSDNTIDYGYFEMINLNADLDHFLVFGDDISCKINDLSFQQYTGFAVKTLKGNFRINKTGLTLDESTIITNYSRISCDFHFLYNSYKDYSSFLDKIKFDVKFQTTQLNLKDIQYFVPSLRGMDNSLILYGRMAGPIKDFVLENFYVKYKNLTNFSGNFAFKDIIHFKDAIFNVNLLPSYVNMDELVTFKLPAGKQIPDIKPLLALGGVKLEAALNGSLTLFNVKLKANTDIGNLSAFLNASPDGNKLNFNGGATSEKLDIGKCLSVSKYLSTISLDAKIEGSTDNPKHNKNFFQSIKTSISGSISQVDIFRYPLQDIHFKAQLQHKLYNFQVDCQDPNCNLNLGGTADLRSKLPHNLLSLSIKKLMPENILKHYNYPIDTLNAKGLEKLILFAANYPTFSISMDTLDLQINGNHIDNIHGYLSADRINLHNDTLDSYCDWIRLTALDPSLGQHKFILSTNFLNASLSTNYNFSTLPDSLIKIAEYYLPQFVKYTPKNRPLPQNLVEDSDIPHFFDFSVTTFFVRDVLNIFNPNLNVSKNAHLSIYLAENRTQDRFDIEIPFVRIAEKFGLENLSVKAAIAENNLFTLHLKGDSVIFFNKENPLSFKNIDLVSQFKDNRITYHLSWITPEEFSIAKPSMLSGYFIGRYKDYISLKISQSELYVKNSKWAFTGKNMITYRQSRLQFDECVLTGDIGKISVNGGFSKKSDENLNVVINNVDMSIANMFLRSNKLSFGGELSAYVVMKMRDGKGAFTGKTFISDFVFNDEKMGNVFLLADAPTTGISLFTGGIFASDSLHHKKINIAEYSYTTYQAENSKLAGLIGGFNPDNKELRIKANIDTLKIGFISPFLSSFSKQISGDASGELNFILTPDSLYFSGNINVKQGFLNIAPLNTTYKLTNQIITFNDQGILFHKIHLQDKFNNNATLDGYVYHQKFKDFKIDLHINTDRILVLNTVKTPDSYFCGDGFVSGEIDIIGDTKKLTFFGQNLKALSGTQIIFPITSASKVSNSQGIRFIAPLEISEHEPKKSGGTEMNYDFTLDITKDALVRIDLEPIDGVLSCRTNGKLRLTYNSKNAPLSLDGMLAIASGKFNMSLKNFIPREFEIVEGGTISFNGPLDKSLVSISALYTKNAMVNNLSDQLNVGRTQVNAYLNLNGPLMNPSPSFAFAFPKLTSEEQQQVFNALDTTNTQNTLRQFFSLVFLNTFAAGEAISNNFEGQSIGNGIDMVANIFNSFLSQQFKNLDLGINYYTDETKYKEYSVNASIPLYNDRILVKTRFGVAENVANAVSSNSSNFVGDASLEYKINEAGNWILKLFYFNDQYELNQDISRPQQGGGFALIFQQEFNNKVDLIETWQMPAERPKKRKYKHHEQ